MTTHKQWTERREKLLAEGRCSQCGGRPKAPFKLCDKCREYHREYRRNHSEKISVYQRKHYAENKETISSRRREDEEKRPNVWKLRRRNSALKRKYGITDAVYNEMYAAQDGKCAICGSGPGDGRPFHVDHEHSTGKIRKLLCRKCNHWIASLERDEKWLEAATMYLYEHLQ
jgi:Autographiviridae endonuclease VII